MDLAATVSVQKDTFPIFSPTNSETLFRQAHVYERARRLQDHRKRSPEKVETSDWVVWETAVHGNYVYLSF